MNTSQKSSLAAAEGAVLHDISSDGEFAEFRYSQSIDEYLKAEELMALPEVLLAAPNLIAYTATVPTDPQLSQWWFVQAPDPAVSFGVQEFWEQYDALPAHGGATSFLKNVAIVIFDTGLAIDHANFNSERPDISGVGDRDSQRIVLWDNLTNESDSYPNIPFPFTADSSPRDLVGHGTAMATITSATPDGQRLAGIAYRNPLWVYKVGFRTSDPQNPDRGAVSFRSVTDAVLHLRDQSALYPEMRFVANMSFGRQWGYSEDDWEAQEILIQAIDHATANGKVLVVASAGNSHGGRVGLPAAFSRMDNTVERGDRVISVGAARLFDRSAEQDSQDPEANCNGTATSSRVRGWASFSSFRHPIDEAILCQPHVDLLAPGGAGGLCSEATGHNIRVSSECFTPGCDPTDSVNGTSVSAAFVSAVAAGLWSKDQSLLAEQVKDALVSYVKRVGVYEGDGGVSGLPLRFGDEQACLLSNPSIGGSKMMGNELEWFDFSGKAGAGIIDAGLAMDGVAARDVRAIIGGTLAANQTYATADVYILEGDLVIPQGVSVTLGSVAKAIKYYVDADENGDGFHIQLDGRLILQSDVALNSFERQHEPGAWVGLTVGPTGVIETNDHRLSITGTEVALDFDGAFDGTVRLNIAHSGIGLRSSKYVSLAANSRLEDCGIASIWLGDTGPKILGGILVDQDGALTIDPAAVKVSVNGLVSLLSDLSVTDGPGGLWISPGVSLNVASEASVHIESAARLRLQAGAKLIGTTNGEVRLSAGGQVILEADPSQTTHLDLSAGMGLRIQDSSLLDLGEDGGLIVGNQTVVSVESGGVLSGSEDAWIDMSLGGALSVASGGVIDLSGGGSVTVMSGLIDLTGGGSLQLGPDTSIDLTPASSLLTAPGFPIDLTNGGNLILRSGQFSIAAGETITLGSGARVQLFEGVEVVAQAQGAIEVDLGAEIDMTQGGSVSLFGGALNLSGGGMLYQSENSSVNLHPGGSLVIEQGISWILSQGSLVVHDQAVLALGSGETLTLDDGNLEILEGGIVQVASSGNLVLNAGAAVTVATGGSLSVQSAGTLDANASSVLQLDPGAGLTVESGAMFDQGAGSRVLDYRAIAFPNVSNGSGLTVPEGSAPYASVPVDYDADGDEDLVVSFEAATVSVPAQLNRNDGTLISDMAQFTDEAPLKLGPGDVDNTRGVNFMDHDNNGTIDLFFASAAGSRLFSGSGGGNLTTEVSDYLGASSTTESHAAAFGDFNSDSLLDVYIVQEGADVLRQADPTGGPTGGFAYLDVSSAAGIHSQATQSGSAMWADIDGDGDQDLFVTHKGAVGSGPNWCSYYRNDGSSGGQVSFTDVTDASSGPRIAPFGNVHGVDFADLNTDGHLDIILARQLAAPGDGKPNLLVLLNDGEGGLVVEPATGFGIDDSDLIADVEISDLDGNSVLDVVAIPTSGTAPLVKLGHDATGMRKYYDGTGDLALGSGAAYGLNLADFNGDADPDLFLLRPETGASKQFLYANPRITPSNPGNVDYLSISFNAMAAGINRLGIGAKVTVTVLTPTGKSLTSTRVVDGGSGRGSQGSSKLIFGLGGASTAAIRVAWPNGQVTQFLDAASLPGYPDVSLDYAVDPQIVPSSISHSYQPGSSTVHKFKWKTLLAGGDPQVLMTIASPASSACKSILGGGTQKLLKLGVAGVTVSSTWLEQEAVWEHKLNYATTCFAVCNYNFTVRNSVGGTTFQVGGNSINVAVCGGFGE